VKPGGVPQDDVERSIGVALLLASVLSVAWMFVARTTGGSAHYALPVAGALIGGGAWLGARTRGPAVQRAAALSFAAFVVFGEVLLYRGALLPRLVALHRAEGAPDAEVLAHQELEGMELTQYLHVELTLTLFAGLAAGLVLALLLTRAPVAVAAFVRGPEASEPPPVEPPPPEPGPAEDDRQPTDAADPETSEWQ